MGQTPPHRIPLPVIDDKLASDLIRWAEQVREFGILVFGHDCFATVFLDRDARVLMHVYKALFPQAEVRLYPVTRGLTGNLAAPAAVAKDGTTYDEYLNGNTVRKEGQALASLRLDASVALRSVTRLPSSKRVLAIDISSRGTCVSFAAWHLRRHMPPASVVRPALLSSISPNVVPGILPIPFESPEARRPRSVFEIELPRPVSIHVEPGPPMRISYRDIKEDLRAHDPDDPSPCLSRDAAVDYLTRLLTFVRATILRSKTAA